MLLWSCLIHRGAPVGQLNRANGRTALMQVLAHSAVLYLPPTLQLHLSPPLHVAHLARCRTLHLIGLQACAFRHVSCVHLLIASHAEVSQASWSGTGALHLACASDCVVCVELLLKARVGPDGAKSCGNERARGPGLGPMRVAPSACVRAWPHRLCAGHVVHALAATAAYHTPMPWLP